MWTRLMDKTPNAREQPIFGCLRAVSVSDEVVAATKSQIIAVGCLCKTLQHGHLFCLLHLLRQK